MLDNCFHPLLAARYHPAMLEVDRNGSLRRWSGDLGWYGLAPRTEMIGTPAEDLLPVIIGLDLDTAQTLPLVQLPGGQPADIVIEPDANGDGSRIFLLAAQETHDTIQPVQQHSHEITLLYQKLQSLSEQLQQKNIELEHAIDARNQFISGVSHEFRTPITTILGHCDLLASYCTKGDDDIQNSFQAIDKNAKYLLALIDNLLEQGEISAKRLVITPAPLDISRFFDFVLDSFQIVAAEKSLSLDFEADIDSGLTLLLDEHHLYLVLVNVIGNAIKFTDRGGVTVTACWQDDHLTIEVRDTGIGIPENELEKILEPFSRASNVGGRRGSGLGLSIIKEVITAMNGEMTIQSAPGKGTTIGLDIPAKRHRPKTRSDDNARSRSDDEKSAVVMIIEDDIDIATLYQIILKNANMSPVCFTDGEDFIDNIKRIRPDIIVLDYNLGQDDGIDLARRARAADYHGPLILFTATSTINSHLEQRALEAGCTRLLQKPRDVTNLAEIIRMELEEHK